MVKLKHNLTYNDLVYFLAQPDFDASVFNLKRAVYGDPFIISKRMFCGTLGMLAHYASNDEDSPISVCKAYIKSSDQAWSVESLSFFQNLSVNDLYSHTIDLIVNTDLTDSILKRLRLRTYHDVFYTCRRACMSIFQTVPSEFWFAPGLSNAGYDQSRLVVFVSRITNLANAINDKTSKLLNKGSIENDY